MSQNAPAEWRNRSAPYQKTFAAGAAPGDITNQVDQAISVAFPGGVANHQNACSGMLVTPTAVTWAVAWKDCNGTVNSIGQTTTVVPPPFPLPYAAISIDTITGCTVTAFWHGSGAGRV